MDQGLLQREVAEIIGVDKTTVYNCEKGRICPEAIFCPAIIDYLGYVPYKSGQFRGERLALMRRSLGLSQREFAREANIDPRSFILQNPVNFKHEAYSRSARF